MTCSLCDKPATFRETRVSSGRAIGEIRLCEDHAQRYDPDGTALLTSPPPPMMKKTEHHRRFGRCADNCWCGRPIGVVLFDALEPLEPGGKHLYRPYMVMCRVCATTAGHETPSVDADEMAVVVREKAA
jgi:hypothetical protein